jgi:hypothetical protein
MDQANQFNTDATAALGGLVQNLQTAKASLESSLSVVTGQQPTPVLPTTGDAEADLDTLGADSDTLGADLDDLDAPAAELDIDIEEPVQGPELGRKRR